MNACSSVKLCLICFMFCFSLLNGQNARAEECSGDIRLLEINYLEGSDRLVLLDDQSLWELKPFEKKRSRTAYEWWMGADPVEWSLDQSYFFDIRTWKKETPIRIYKIDRGFHSSFEYVLENIKTDEKVLAKSIPYASRPIPKLEYLLPMLESPYSVPLRISRNISFVDNIILLEDGSFWIVKNWYYNYRSFSEWWKGIEIEQPDSQFVFNLRDWSCEDLIQIYRYSGDSHMYNPHGFKGSDVQGVYECYVFENITQGHFAYAVSISVDQFCDLYAEYVLDELDEAYDDGYDDGLLLGS